MGPGSPERFINRELSWLDFNMRVVEEAENARHPLLERLRFISISASNLDEFISVRVAGLVGQVGSGIGATSPDGLTPAQQLDAVRDRTHVLLQRQQLVWLELRELLGQAGLELVEAPSLTDAELAWLDHWFMERVFPVVTPLAIDPAHPFPFIPNMGLVMALQLQMEDDGQHMRGLLPLPSTVDRFVRLPPTQAGTIRFVALETLVTLFLGRVFPGFRVVGQGLFRLIRDTDVEFEDEAEDLVRSYETALKRRRVGVVIHLAVDSKMPEELVAMVADNVGANQAEICCFRPTRRGFRNASAISAATALPPSAPRTSWCTIRSRVSTWWCSSCARPPATPPWLPSSKLCIAPAATAPSSRR
jgi:polyphosphate kinase